MKPIINSNLTTLPQLQLSASSTERLDLSNPKIIEALVLSSTLLKPKAGTAFAGQQFLIKLHPPQTNPPQIIEVIADKPIAKGSQLTLKMSIEKTVQIIDIKQPQTTPPVLNEQAVIDNLLRQALPIKQGLVKLLPLLQQLNTAATTSTQALPKPLVQAINQLLKSFPETQTLQNSNGVKRAIFNSGTFFESKMAAIVKTAVDSGGTIKSPQLSQLLKQDIKGQLQQLLKYVEQLNVKAAYTAPQPSKPTTPIYNTAAQQTPLPGTQTPSLLTSTTLPHIAQPLIASHNTASQSNNENLGLVLKQLSRQLMSSLAQTQVHQAETLTSRGPPQADGQPTVNNWTLELPVFNGKHIDNIDIQIKREEENKHQDGKASQWTIMLNFDLHSLGKIKVQLSVIEQSVSATVWSEAEPTHNAVKQHINDLQKNFEQVGIHVKRIECLLGKPIETQYEIRQQLVDTHS